MATVYISSTGDDSRTYVQAQSSATPWLTVAKANTSAVSGDTVVIMAGTLTWAAVTFTKNFTITGVSATTSILDAGGLKPMWDFGTTTCTVSNLTFQNFVAQTSNSNEALRACEGGVNLTVSNCIFRNGTYTDTASNNFGLIGGAAGATSSGTATLTITNCVFHKVEATAAGNRPVMIMMKGAGTIAAVLTITGCSFYWKTSVTGQLFGPNTLGGASFTATIKNCILYNDTGVVLTFVNNQGTFTVTYCDCYQITSTPAGTGNITSDPLFIDAPNGDLRLRPSSPCIGTGTLL